MAIFPLISCCHDRNRKERGTKKERNRCKGRENYRKERESEGGEAKTRKEYR